MLPTILLRNQFSHGKMWALQTGILYIKTLERAEVRNSLIEHRRELLKNQEQMSVVSIIHVV
jgi:hypothetical protein